ncbi:tail fiber domain-containing protein [Chryseobacterium sp.]|uniref:tail fiber domain-containing protein n=1 Tax=Chryseobacterium sp. TaxID=1871047 RepID=UPI002FCA5832
MKKCLVAMLVSGLAYSQVGINTQTPKSTLDVMVNPTGSKPEGIIAPRMTGDALRSRDLLYTTDQNAALVYVTLGDTAPAGKTINVTSPGYYYFDAVVTNTWIKLGTGGSSTPAGPTPAAWYPGGNTESSEKTLGTNNNFDLPIVTNGTEKARLTTAGFFGVGTDTPEARFHMKGDGLFTDDMILESGTTGTPFLHFVRPVTTAGQFLGQFAFGRTKSETLSGVQARYAGGTTSILDFITSEAVQMRLDENGFLGVGTSNPTHGIHLVSTGDNNKDNIAITTNTTPAFLSVKTNPSPGALGSLQFQGTGVSTSGVFGITESSGTKTALGLNTSDTEQMRITGNGFVGVGTSTPLSRLHIEGTDSDPGGASSNDLRLSSYKNVPDGPTFFITSARGTVSSPSNLQTNDYVGRIRFLGEVGGSQSSLAEIGYHYLGNGSTTSGELVFAVNNTIRATLNQAGTFNVIGSVQSHGVTLSSDARFKTDIATIKNALPIITSLRGTTYEMNKAAFPERHFADGKQYGVIAQEIEKVLPELVITNEDGYKSVNYQGMIPVLIEAVKEQQKIIQQLQKDMEQLKK